MTSFLKLFKQDKIETNLIGQPSIEAINENNCQENGPSFKSSKIFLSKIQSNLFKASDTRINRVIRS